MKDFDLNINIKIGVAAFNESDVENQYDYIIEYIRENLEEEDYNISIEEVGEWREYDIF